MAKTRGYNTVYLGQSVPFHDLIKVNSISESDYFVTVITQALKEIEISDYLKQLSEALPKQKIFVSGYQVIHHSNKTPKNVVVFKTPAEFSQFL